MNKIALFFDTETTGFKSATYTPRIVQLAAILQDTESKRVLQEYNTLIITDGIEIPEVVTKIHGITNVLADAYGMGIELVDQLFGTMILKADILVAHNISFDLEMVQCNFPSSAGVLSQKKKYCTMLNSTKIVGIPGTHMNGNKYPRLGEAYQYFFGKQFDNAHDAMADVRACRDVYFALQERYISPSSMGVVVQYTQTLI